MALYIGGGAGGGYDLPTWGGASGGGQGGGTFSSAIYPLTVASGLPGQGKNGGKYVVVNGTTASWAELTTDPLPQVFLMMGA